MNEFWIHILLGFFGGFIFAILLVPVILKKMILFFQKLGDKDE